MDPISALPEDVVRLLLYNLDYQDTVAVGKLSSRSQSIIRSPDLWRSKILLLKPEYSKLLTDKSWSQLFSIYQLLTNPGDVYGWGDNAFGQLGIVNDISLLFSRPILISTANVVQVACGRQHSAFLTDEGKVYTFGLNYYGNLGIGNPGDRIYNPTPVPLPYKISKIICGYVHTIFVTTDGLCYGCGSNYQGQLGLVNIPTFREARLIPHLPSIIDGAASDHSALLTANGEVYVSGSNDQGELGLGDVITGTNFTKISDLPKIIQVACGPSTTLFLTSEGQIYGCGYGKYLGLGNLPITTPQRLFSLTNISSLACGTYHNIAVDIFGTAYTWGDNYNGQLGLGDNRDRLTPTILPEFHNIAQVTCGSNFTIIITIDGEMYTWGNNISSQLGLGHMIATISRPTPIRGKKVIQAAAGQSQVLALFQK